MSAPQEIMMHEVGRRVSVTPILWSHRHDRPRLCVMFFWALVREIVVASRVVC